MRYICTEVINDFVRQVIVPPHYTLYDNVVSVLGEDEVSPASAGTEIIVLVCTKPLDVDCVQILVQPVTYVREAPSLRRGSRRSSSEGDIPSSHVRPTQVDQVIRQ